MGKIDTDHRDASARPQDDLFQHVNGSWLAQTPIPPDRSSVGTFYAVRDAAEEAVHQLLQQAATERHSPNASHETALVGELYANFLDTEHIESLGITPIRADLDAIQELDSLPAFVTLSARFQRSLMSGLLAFCVSNDPGDPQRLVLHLTQSGLGLPDESYYREEHFAPQREQYRKYLQRLLTLCEYDDAEAATERIYALECSLAAAHRDMVTLRDPYRSYNLLSRTQALALMPLLESWFQGLGITPEQSDSIVFVTPEHAENVQGLLHEYPLSTWKAWLTTRLLMASAPYLPEDFVAASFEFHGKALTGAQNLRPRWKRGVSLVEMGLGDAVGRLYVAEHFSEAHKQVVKDLVGHLLEAYQQSIESLDWMGPQTKARAIAKLNKLLPKIGYPDSWRDYSALQLVPGHLIQNIRVALAFETVRELNKIGQTPDPDAWLMTPQTVNAYFHPTRNEIVFPAAILCPPFFDLNSNAATNFGAIGAVIGHEVGHAFDDQGSQFDADGKLANWWTDDDREAFETRAGRLVDQYNVLAPIDAPQHTINGELTLGENIGDLGGLAIAYQAWRLSQKLPQHPQTPEDLAQTQQFFYSWARCWRGKCTPQEAERRVSLDPHSPPEWRCNQVVKNLDAFHHAFQTSERDRLWLAPEERVSIW